MITLSATEITKSYGVDTVLDRVSFHVEKGDRIGVIGTNGAGKTTLLKILAGETDPDSGSFFVSEGTDIGYLKQADTFFSERTVVREAEMAFEGLRKLEREIEDIAEEIEKAAPDDRRSLVEKQAALEERYGKEGGYEYKSRLRGILKSMALGEEFFDKKVNTLSGGERTRLALSILLLKDPTVLLLDEPTNHLDIGTLNWLEQYLKGYGGTLIVVSHDRYFLNKVTNKIFEIENHRLSIYEGSYSYYAEEKKRRREEALRKYNAKQAEIKKQEEIIRRFKGHGTEKLAKRAASRERMLEHMEPVERPEGEKGKIKMRFRENFKSGNDVITAEDLSKSFGYGSGKRLLFENVDLDIKRGDRFCIVGPNGVGKTTLLKILMGAADPVSGYVKPGHNVTFGYYDQEQKLLNDDMTVLEEMRESYGLYSDTELRTLLGSFLFTGDTVFLPVRALSGGERARLSLLKLMMSGANTLILDEPTNHLDINSKEIFEEALGDFPGTAVIVSHDRYFLSKVPTKIAELTPGGIEIYPGRYDYYTEKKEQLASGKKYLENMDKQMKGKDEDPCDEDPADGPGEEAGLSPAEERRLKKEKEARERRLKRSREKLENEISELEEKIRGLEKTMMEEDVAKDHLRLGELSRELDRCNEELSAKYEEWCEL